jgi:hypothetical protein
VSLREPVAREPVARPFVVVWRLAVREQTRLSFAQVAIAHTIATYMRPGGWTGPDTRYSPSRAAIAAGAHCTTRAVDMNLPTLEAVGLLEILRGKREQHVYVATIEENLAKHLLAKRLARDVDFESYERLVSRPVFVGTGANEVLYPGRTLFTPVVNVVPDGGEPGSPEIVSLKDDDLDRAHASVAAEIDRSLHVGGARL